MVIYLEACEGGSMFDNIIGDRDGIFVTTAAATNENSFAYYCEYSTYDACLGDFYSITWMEQMDLLRESWSDRYVTLFKQYRHVRTNVNKSRVMMYGDFRLGFDRLSHFLGDDGSTKRTLPASNEAPELKMVTLNFFFPQLLIN
ncbi:hypothetical protein AAG570_008095 [Ranatra chinensis]|uniref:Uncharacterized protein n=1 Tax=Ranatra chinensis TaxID=642074 RepID=A0ABD0XTR2_9HEMI